jgi:hydrogenase maturation protein HypF
MAAVMAEHGLSSRVVGLCCDGVGYGTDGTLWGCEVLVGDRADCERVGRLRPFPLFGGDAAAVDTWRPAAGLLHELFGPGWIDAWARCFDRVDQEALRLALARLGSPTATLPRTSSLGRLFDAAAFLLGVCDRNRAEAEAPMAFQALAAQAEKTDGPAHDAIRSTAGDAAALFEMNPLPLIDALRNAPESREGRARRARGFHEGLARLLASGAARAADQAGLDRVVLSGGCFANRLLLSGVYGRLRRLGFDVYIHERVPSGDGGLALGQAAAAAARIRRGGD